MSELENNMAFVKDLARKHSAILSDDQRDEIDSLADHAEPGVAFEMLCSLLYEYKWPVNPRDLEELDDFSRRLRIEPSELRLWRQELRADTGRPVHSE